jgi:hypothetical protein
MFRRNKDHPWQGSITPKGELTLQVTKNPRPIHDLSIDEIKYYSTANPSLSTEVNEWRDSNKDNIKRGLSTITAAKRYGISHFYGRLWIKLTRVNGEEIDYGLASLRVVTDVGVGFIVDAFQNSVELENMKFHALGTGTNNEAAGDTALQTELTTEYATNNTRPTGTTTEGATANIYRTVGSNTVDGAVAATEHGIFSQAANSGGVLLDRSKFAVINLASGDTLTTTYDLTFTSGG